MDNLEIATGSDEETEQSPPPIPPRTSSFVPRTPSHESSNQRQPVITTISDSSDSTSSDASEIREDTSSDSDDTTEDDKLNILNNKTNEFDANSSLPPVPNGTLDLTSPDKQQKFSSDEEKYVLNFIFYIFLKKKIEPISFFLSANFIFYKIF